MAGKEHQFILGLVIKQMRLFGCEITHVDGTYRGKQNESVPLPPRVVHHRPDAMGITALGQVCFGDAKTEGDIRSRRTKEQLLDFLTMELNGLPCAVFLGVPSRAKENAVKLLREMGLLDHSHLRLIFVPEEIINA